MIRKIKVSGKWYNVFCESGKYFSVITDEGTKLVPKEFVEEACNERPWLHARDFSDFTSAPEILASKINSILSKRYGEPPIIVNDKQE